MSDDNRKVTVCAGCLRAFCWLKPSYKQACDKRPEGLSVEKTVAELREIATGEHKSWWKEGAGRHDDPRDEEDVRDLVEWYTKKPPKDGDPPHDPRTFVSYLYSQAGAQLGPLKKLLAEIYPAAALCIELPSLAQAGADTADIDERTSLLAMLEDRTRAGTLAESDARMVIEEWDALHFPSQVPEAIRERALWRHRRALALFPHVEAPVQ